jgi:hypothetical protein
MTDEEPRVLYEITLKRKRFFKVIFFHDLSGAKKTLAQPEKKTVLNPGSRY